MGDGPTTETLRLSTVVQVTPTVEDFTGVYDPSRPSRAFTGKMKIRQNLYWCFGGTADVSRGIRSIPRSSPSYHLHQRDELSWVPFLRPGSGTVSSDSWVYTRGHTSSPLAATPLVKRWLRGSGFRDRDRGEVSARTRPRRLSRGPSSHVTPS